jgi:hypothetical protein
MKPEIQTAPAATQVVPAKRAFSLPDDFDPAAYPHFSVQISIYSLLLTTLSLAEHYEPVRGAEARQVKLDALFREYRDTCDAIRIKSADFQSH